MGVYERYGIRTIINAAGPMTRLSGGVLAPEVRAAMAEAGSACARIEDLQAAAGRLIAETTGAEAGYVTNGAAAGLTLGAAATVAGLDVAHMDRLPDTVGMRNEIIIQRQHLTAYSHAYRLAGARLIEVGYLGYPGQGITWPWQVEAAITERTAAIAFSVGNVPGAVDLAGIVAIARRNGLPVIVDAAAALPPPGNLRRFVAEGADLVCFSGGKAIGGPQASGIIAGRAELIDSIALQHQDMDVLPETWTWRAEYLASGRLPGPPHHGLGRPMKVGKEEIIGLMVALERFVALDFEAERARWRSDLQTIADVVAGLPGVSAALREGPVPTLAVYLDETRVERSVEAVINALIEEDPPIAVSQNLVTERGLGINPLVLQPGEADIIGQRLRQVLGF
jgi:L-seryl-tRNA(Ser) seleniumtransferase